jgi:transketolase
MQHRQPPEGWDASLSVFPADPKGLASRESSGQVLNVLARNVPWLMGGAADLAPSTKTRLTFDDAGDFEAGSYMGGTSTSASANTRCARWPTACRWSRSARSLRRS